jgi:hypothetical protein
VLGAGGLRRLYDKWLKLEMLKTDKFFGGEIPAVHGPRLRLG